MRRVQWSITTRAQYVRRTAVSDRNKSRLHRLSVACPRTVSQDGPAESGLGSDRTARLRRTTSLLMEMPKAKAICCAIRGQPQVGFRRFMSHDGGDDVLARSLRAGLHRRLGREEPAILPRFQHSNSVDGLKTIAERINRCGCIKSVHRPATTRSEARRLGDRVRERLRISSWCLTSTGYSHDPDFANGEHVLCVRHVATSKK